MRYFFSFIILLTAISFGYCSSQNIKSQEEKSTPPPATTVQSDTKFPLPDIPTMLNTPEQRIAYLSVHFWDLFNFSDSTLISQPEITEQGLVDYIFVLRELSKDEADISINDMLEKAKPYPHMYKYFISLYEKYLDDPNSPFRNENLYESVLKHLISSDALSDLEKEKYRFEYKLSLKNKVGTTATNFTYTLENQEKKWMHAIKSNYLILMFSNPSCSSCAATTEEIENSKILRNIFSLNSADSPVLTILNIYPDNEIDEWRRALPSLPKKNWINAYDDGTVITNKNLYDIKAIPTLYLLDKNKKVLLKDAQLKEIETYFMQIK